MHQYGLFGTAAVLIILQTLPFLQAQLYSHSYSLPAPTYVVDLNKNAEERWKEVAEIFASNISTAIDACITVATLRFKMNKEEMLKGFDELAKLLEGKNKTANYFKEIVGFSKYSNISNDRLHFLNLHVDYVLKATTLISKTFDNKIFALKTIHMNATKPLRDIAINVDFRKDGKNVYRGALFAGMVGIVFGMRANELAISFNRRITTVSLKERLQAAMDLARLKTEIWPPSLLVRDMLADEAKTAFMNRIEFLLKVPLTAPCMIAVSKAKYTMDLGVGSSKIVFRRQLVEDPKNSRKPANLTIRGRSLFGSWDSSYPDNVWYDYPLDETFCHKYTNQAYWALRWKLEILGTAERVGYITNYSMVTMKQLGFYATQGNTAIAAITSAALDRLDVLRVMNSSVIFYDKSRASSSQPRYPVLLLGLLCIPLLH